MFVGRNNGVVGLTRFSEKKMSGLLFGPQKSGRNNRVVVLTGWSYDGVPLYKLSQNKPNEFSSAFIVAALVPCVHLQIANLLEKQTSKKYIFFYKSR